METIRPTQTKAWMEVLQECPAHDFYHLPGYHALAESRGEGEAFLFAYRDEGCTLALPLLLRPVNGAAGLEDADAGRVDATSVYGYAGPIASHAEIPAPVLARFRESLRETLLGIGVTTVFSRLHPLLPQSAILAGLGEQIGKGKTVSIDLTVPLETQRARYRRNHRRDLRTLEKLGVTCLRAAGREHLAAFVAVYREAMARVHADEGYFFDEPYFAALAETLGERMQLFLCLLEGRVIAGGLFTALNGIAQAHLAGCLDEQVKIAPQKLLYDAAAVWAREQGCHTFHIGGGIGSREDSLLYFKLGFSETTHTFSTWQWVVDPVATDALAARKRRWMEEQRMLPAVQDFFPAYRVQAVAAPDPAAQDAAAEGGVLVFGAGGHAKVIISALIASGLSVAAVLDDDRRKWGQFAFGLPVSAPKTLGSPPAVIAVGDNEKRKAVATTWSYSWRTVVHPQSAVDPSVRLGPGTVVFAGAVLQTDAVLGRHVIVNTGATVDHDCVIGDFAHIGPGVHLAGSVEVGEGAFLGIGAVVLPGVKIGDWTTVGAGSVVTRDLPQGVTAFGSPARIQPS